MPFYQKQSQISELHLEYDHIITFPLCVSSKKHKSSNREKIVTQTIKGLWVSSLVFPCTFSTFSSPCLETSSTNNLRGKRDGLFSTCMYMHIIYSHSQNQISKIIVTMWLKIPAVHSIKNSAWSITSIILPWS